MSQVSKKTSSGDLPTLVQTVTTQDGIATAAANNLNFNGYPQVVANPQIGITHASGSTFTYEDRTWQTAYVVDPSSTIGNRGTYSTIAAAITDAPSGTTIFIRPGTYTENLTLKAGVSLQGFDASQEGQATVILGNMTASYAGTANISGLTLRTNGAAFLTVSGSNATIVNIYDSYLDITNSTGIVNSGSGTPAIVNIRNCNGNIGTTGITLFTMTNNAGLQMDFCEIGNSGGSTTASTSSSPNTVTLNSSQLNFPISVSSSGSVTAYFTQISTSVSALTTAGTGISSINNSYLSGLTASAVNIGSGTTVGLNNCTINSSNTNAITGAGNLVATAIMFDGTSSGHNVTSETYRYSELGRYNAAQQPRFSAYLNTAAVDVTGDGTNVILGTGTAALTELYDVGSNFNTNGTFTAPVTGLYHFNFGILAQEVAAANSLTLQLITTGRNYTYGNFGSGATGNMPLWASRHVQMTAGDTAQVQVNVAGGTKIINIYGGANDPRTFFEGMLIA